MYFRSSRVYTVVLQMCRCARVHRHAVFATPHVAENGRLAVHTLRPGMQSGTQTPPAAVIFHFAQRRA